MPKSRGSRRSKRGQVHRPISPALLASVGEEERGPGGATYQVQRVGGASKPYVCPGCLHEIAPGTPHIVAWPTEAAYGLHTGVGARRHWHASCWGRRLRPD